MKIKSLVLSALLLMSSSSMAAIVNFTIETDLFPSDTSWSLTGSSLTDTFDTITGDPYEDSYGEGDENLDFNYSWDLSEGDYELTILDASSDGIDNTLGNLDAGYSLAIVSQGEEFIGWQFAQGLNDENVISFTIAPTTNTVPEPSILFLMGFGLMGLSWVKGKNKS